MPAIFDSLVHSRGLSPHQAWRVTYIVPFIIITSVALGMLLTCDDTPTGKWSERHLWIEEQKPGDVSVESGIVDVKSGSRSENSSPLPSENVASDVEKKAPESPDTLDREAQVDGQADYTKGEVVVAPTTKETMKVTFSLATLAIAAPYACSFGAELAINSILGAYYAQNFPSLGQTESGRWAAMFGLLNAVFRPMGGLIADVIYHYTRSVWAKKIWLISLGVVMGAFQLAMGLANPKREATMFGLAAGMAFFLEACNGANFAVVPHVHPFANGGLFLFACIFSASLRTLADARTSLFRHRVRHRWRHGKPRRHHLRHHLPLQRIALRPLHLDNRGHMHWREPRSVLDPADPQGSDWWSMSINISGIVMVNNNNKRW